MSAQYTVLGFEPLPLEHESPPITTRPGLLPYLNARPKFTSAPLKPVDC